MELKWMENYEIQLEQPCGVQVKDYMPTFCSFEEIAKN